MRSLLSMTLVSGTYVCQPRFDPAGTLALIRRHRITNLYLVPTLYHDLLADPRVRDGGRVERTQARIRGARR